VPREDSNPPTLTDSDAPFGAKKRDFVIVRRVFKLFFVFCGATLVALIAYASRTYVKDIASQTVLEQLSSFNQLPNKIQSLEEFKDREEKTSDNTRQQVNMIFVKLSALETMQDVNNKNTERILHKLDSLK
jgi:hypothetical protein